MTPPPPLFMELRRDEKITGDPRCPPHPPVNIRQNVVVDGGRWGGRTRPLSSTSLPSSTVSPQQLFPTSVLGQKKVPLQHSWTLSQQLHSFLSVVCSYVSHDLRRSEPEPCYASAPGPAGEQPPQPLARGPLLFQFCSFRLLLFSIFKRCQN